MKIFCCICKKELERKPCLIKRVKHNVCSYKCRNILYSQIYTNHQENTSCDECGKKIYKKNKEIHRTKHNFCSTSCYGKYFRQKKGKENLHWKGGKKAALVRRQSKRRCLGHDCLNEPFEGCEGHHIDKKHILYIPKRLHRSVWHSLSKSETMEKINTKVFCWLLGKTEAT
jgi:hypothetical protein